MEVQHLTRGERAAMTPNCTAESETSYEASCLRIEPGTRSDVGPSGQRGDVGQAVLLRRASNRRGRRLSSGTTLDSHPPLLSALEERKLAERIRAGDQLAQQELVLAHRKLVYRIVRNYKSSGISDEDLVQEGSVGLIRAAQNFDPSTHAIRFSCYATFWIRAFIQRAVSNNSSLVRLPEYTRLLRERYLRARASSGTRPTPRRNPKFGNCPAAPRSPTTWGSRSVKSNAPGWSSESAR